jgi:hypothetical protein
MQALCRKNTQLRAIWQSSPTSKVVFSIHFTDIAKQLAPGRCVTWFYPTGKSPARFIDPPVNPLLKKYSVFQKCKSPLYSQPSRPNRGAIRDRHVRGAGCGGRGCADNERC